MIEARFLTNSADHIDTFTGWWAHYYPEKANIAPFLSNYVTVAYDGVAPLAMQFVYPSLGSNIAWISFTARNPGISAYKAGLALQLLFKASEDGVQKLGWNIIFTGYDNSALHGILEKRHYKQGSTINVKEYWRNLWDKQ